MTEIILITEKKQSSPKPDLVDESAPKAQYCFFLFRGRLGCFCLKEKSWIIIKKDEIPFQPTLSWDFLLLGVGMAWHSSLSDSVFQTLHPTWLKENVMTEAFMLQLGKKYGWVPIIPSSHSSPSTFYQKKKRKKQNEINRSRGGMKPLKLKESQHQRVSLHPL